MKRLVAAFFSRAGASYCEAARVQREAARDCVSAVPGGHHGVVVEIGTGQGMATAMLRASISFERYVGLDIAPGMLAAMTERGPRELHVVADGECPPLTEGCADLLVSSSTMQWYRDPARSIPANLRLLRPGGAFSFSIFVEGTLSELAQASRLSGFGDVVHLRSAQEYEWIVDGVPGVECESRLWEVRERYATVRDLLRTLKRSGVTGAGAGRAFSRRCYENFETTYRRLHGDADGVAATWRVLYLWGRRVA
ncbi:malonyl-CoA O-methyltransferase [Desulfobaculum xiamenense]|uniref:Malonyl-CoA O-methyltransferase n=1 Tax=Desulfobaculum xiamenense TaxID=995050 RepID=A0A846QFQ8_9BACT|nr:methyltransferase domain-containing protein [Desulfobaculum xiamenense]NJB67158.1 malonyl-CoA O-methyltransferase [Desulfobaculum xiamenense]